MPSLSPSVPSVSPTVPDLALDSAHEPLIGLPNTLDLTAGDGWAQIAPYGRWPHREGLQVFERADAEAIVAQFKSTWGRIKRAVVGIPLFRGHPDHIQFANTHTDATAYGQWSDLAARADGLWGRPVISPAGAALIESGLKYLSPNWRCLRVPLANSAVWRPRILDSVGLTDTPNIPGRSLVNTTPPPMNPSLLLQLLTALGLPVEPAPTDDQLNAHLTAAIPLAKSLAARPDPASTTAPTASNSPSTPAAVSDPAATKPVANETTTAAATTVAALHSQLSALSSQLTAAQAARNAALVTAAVSLGRIPEAARPVWLGRLERDFAAESVALANESGALKTTPRTAALGTRKLDSAAAEQFTALVNEALPAHAHNWSAAWAAVKATAKGQQLFTQMQSA